MSVKRGILKYRYRISINLEDIADKVMNVIKPYCDDYEFESDGDTLEITVNDTSSYCHYHSPATILDPPEDETVVETIKDLDMESVVLAALHDIGKVRTNVEIISEEYKEDE